jgi:hypothetical protein
VTKELKVFVIVFTKTVHGKSQLYSWTVASDSANGGFNLLAPEFYI